MTYRFLLLFAFVISSLAGNSLHAQVRDLTADDIDAWVKELSNWGRWGKSDQLGALNLITPKKRVQAAQLVKEGVSVSLSVIAQTEEAPDNPQPFIHTMLNWGKGTDSQWASDNFNVSYHGLVHTHMDSLCHLFYKDKLYNGFSRNDITETGANKLSIHNVQNGIFTRGILVDIPELRGVDYLEPGTPIYPEELERWEMRTGVKVEPGDVVFIRTGRFARRAEKGPWSQKDGMAGLHASCAKWIHDRDIAMLGSDAASDVIPSGVTGIDFPIHLLTIHAMGIHIFDNCDLEALHAQCKKSKRWHFLIQSAPIPVKGGTGSPLNPIATF
ncbi:MAG: cyclase family protein [Pirellulaceae bacterium]